MIADHVSLINALGRPIQVARDIGVILRSFFLPPSSAFI